MTGGFFARIFVHLDRTVRDCLYNTILTLKLVWKTLTDKNYNLLTFSGNRCGQQRTYNSWWGLFVIMKNRKRHLCLYLKPDWYEISKGLIFFPAKFQNTSRPGVYALGDVCGKALLTPGKDIYSCYSQNSIPAWFSRVMLIAFKMSLIIVFKISNFRQTRRLPNNYLRLSKDFRTLLKTPDNFPIFLTFAVPKFSTVLKYDLEVRVCVEFCVFFFPFFCTAVVIGQLLAIVVKCSCARFRKRLVNAYRVWVGRNRSDSGYVC